MRRLEVGDAQGAPIALEPVAQDGQSTLVVHALAEVGQHLLARLPAKLRFELRPLVRLRLADEAERGLRKDGTLPVEAVVGDRHIAVRQQVSFDDGLEGGFGGGFHGVFAVMSSSDATPRKSFALCVTNLVPWRTAQAAIHASFGSMGLPFR